MTPEQQTVIRWLGSDDTGISSETLAHEFLNSRAEREWPPCDPADLGRCLRLIRTAPSVRECVDRLGRRDAKWAIAANHWDEITSLMEDEVGIDWSKGDTAPKTYKRMKEIGL